MSALRCVAVVGTGPAGLYAAKYLIKKLPNVRIDLFDSCPMPFGLVRYGVAPDHPEVKRVSLEFSRMIDLNSPRVRYFGNVKVSRDVSVHELKNLYTATVFATGAAGERKLGIPGEDLPGVFSARKFVSWYNGHPESTLDKFPLDSSCTGNVAVDCARILAMTSEKLSTLNGLSLNAMQSLSASRSARRSVWLVGRRGPIQAQFTTPELRELADLAKSSTEARIRLLIAERDLGDAKEHVSFAQSKTERAKKRRQEILSTLPLFDYRASDTTDASLEVKLSFFWRPVRFVAHQHAHRLAAVEFQRTQLADDGSCVDAGERLLVPTSFALFAIGYLPQPLEGLPFDHVRGVVPSLSGRVVSQNQVVPGAYVAGWLKRGSTGIIGSNVPDASETVEAVLEDLAQSKLQEKYLPPIDALLADRGVPVVSWDGVRSIVNEENRRGRVMSSHAEMLETASRGK